MPLPTESKARKEIPLYEGLFQFFPDALAAVARRSYTGSKQHHPDKPVSWDRSKSTDELDALLRHILDEDWDAVAWRALAHLQKQEEKRHAADESRKHDRSLRERVRRLWRSCGVTDDRVPPARD